MKEKVIEVENISKRYLLGASRSSNFRELFSSALKKIINPKKGKLTEFWSLKDICFEVHSGDILGLIGRNGAGKSTLLKILSRITSPTSGKAWIKGKVGSLLEVGTGFHPDLTGRENTFLNGAILGMQKQEIKRKFDEIVDFAGIEKFIDTPVKHYSSGMYVRLGFAIAAHLEPDILIVDEVLAVGDIAFQKKCIGKMQDVAGHGRTILFVSHNIQAVNALCTRGIVLQDGKIIADVTAKEATELFIRQFNDNLELTEENPFITETVRRGRGDARFEQILVQDLKGEVTNNFEYQQGFSIISIINIKKNIKKLRIVIYLTSMGERIPDICFSQELPQKIYQENEKLQVKLTYERSAILPGIYAIYCWLGDPDSAPFDVLDNALNPIVISTTEELNERMGMIVSQNTAAVLAEAKLEIINL